MVIVLPRVYVSYVFGSHIISVQKKNTAEKWGEKYHFQNITETKSTSRLILVASKSLLLVSLLIFQIHFFTVCKFCLLEEINVPLNDMRPLKSNAEPTDAFFTAVHHRSIKLKKKSPWRIHEVAFVRSDWWTPTRFVYTVRRSSK